MPPLIVKTTDCSCDDLLKVAKRVGFSYFQGRKHCKIKTGDGKFVTMIPRSKSLSKHTVKGILQAFIKFGADIIIV